LRDGYSTQFEEIESFTIVDLHVQDLSDRCVFSIVSLCIEVIDCEMREEFELRDRYGTIEGFAMIICKGLQLVL